LRFRQPIGKPELQWWTICILQRNTTIIILREYGNWSSPSGRLWRCRAGGWPRTIHITERQTVYSVPT
jgi:hypothetical protein